MDFGSDMYVLEETGAWCLTVVGTFRRAHYRVELSLL